ncbi:hypothetical protein HJG60_008723 [Phyllostomus discolor]|uniref:Uncharacterized protein n=1 Tax=Phyllostomus discolor TaxID=89673 RepID=A0A834DFU6_9CHIR|nr:hypothetical protein HJG60_008723 [Phyllostomus discolor]
MPGCLRTEDWTPGPQSKWGQTDRRPGDRAKTVPARGGWGWGQGPGGVGGVAGRAETGWDVTSGALCIVGIPGPRLLVPVHSAEEPGGGGERGACGREARRRAARASAEREEKRRERSRGHRPNTSLLPPPPSRP